MAHAPQPPATRRVYDACVVGSQLAGAVAGALLARRGHRVLCVAGGDPGASYEDGGWLLPSTPASLAAPRLWPAAEAVLRELGLLADVQRSLQPSATDLQIVLPRARLDLSRDPARRSAELRREWPAEAPGLEQALAEAARLFDAATPFLASLPPLPPAGLGERWALRRRLRALAPGGIPPAPFAGLGSHPLARAISTAARFLGHLDGDLPPLAAVRLQGAVIHGTWRLPAGLEGLAEAIRRKMAESRGEILGGEGGPGAAEGLELEGRVARAVRVAGSRDAFAARVFLLATDPVALRRLLPEAERGARRAHALDLLEVRGEVGVVNWVVSPEALPPGLGDAALALPGEEAEGAVLLQTAPARRAPGAAEDRARAQVLCAAAILPTSARERGEEGILEWADRVRAALADVLPFLEGHLVHRSIPLLAARSDRGLRPALHPLYRAAPDRALGVGGLSPRSPWRNVIFASREVLPGLGVEGEFHAGLRAADLAEGILGKPVRPR